MWVHVSRGSVGGHALGGTEGSVATWCKLQNGESNRATSIFGSRRMQLWAPLEPLWAPLGSLGPPRAELGGTQGFRRGAPRHGGRRLPIRP